MIVISYYTYNTPYQVMNKALDDSCKKHNLRHHAVGYVGLGRWELNCGLKPSFILEMLKLYDGEDLLYVDSDAIIEAAPPVPEGDFGVYYKTHKDGSTELLSGTIYLHGNIHTKFLVTKWVEEQSKTPLTWDQKTLAKVVETSRLQPTRLPQGYTKIYDASYDASYDGTTYVRHNQASRTCKKDVEDMFEPSELPTSINGVRIRHGNDGSILLARNNKELESYLDANYIRIPNQLAWFPKCKKGKGLDCIKGMFSDGAYIIGKGPSLDDLTEADFEKPYPVICINESIHKVEELKITNQLFCIQQDQSLKGTCQPRRGTLLIQDVCEGWYPDLENKIIYRMAEFGCNSALTVQLAIRLVKQDGCKDVILYGFDSFNKNTGYAKCIGYSPNRGGDPNRFLEHGKIISKELSSIDVVY